MCIIFPGMKGIFMGMSRYYLDNEFCKSLVCHFEGVTFSGRLRNLLLYDIKDFSQKSFFGIADFGIRSGIQQLRFGQRLHAS